MADLEVAIKFAADEASAAKAKKTASDVSQQVSDSLAKIGRRNELNSVAAEFASFAKETGNSTTAVAGLTKQLELLGATKDEVSAVTSEFARLSEAKSGGLGVSNLGNKAQAGLSKLGGAASALGLGSGVSDVAGVVGSLGSLKEFQAVLGGLGVAGATAAEGTAVASTGLLGVGATALAALAPLAPLLLAGAAAAGAVAIAVKGYTDSMEAQRKVIAATAEANKKVGESLAQGASTQDLTNRLLEVQRLRDQETERLNTMKQAYEDNINSLGVFGTALKIVDTREEEASNQIAEAQKNVEGFGAEINTLTSRLDAGAAAANDAATALSNSIDAQRSVIDAIVGGATTTDAQKTIATLEQRKALEEQLLAGLQEQQSALEITSPAYQALADQIATSQGNITNATDSITAYNTAINNNSFAAANAKQAEEERKKQIETANKEQEKASADLKRIRDKQSAERKKVADKEAADTEKEQNALQQKLEKTADIQTKYKQGLEDIGRSYKQATADAKTKLGQATADLSKNFGRDMQDLAGKFADDQAKYTQDRQREEIDATKDFNRKLADINRSANDSAEDSAANRNILEIANIRKQQQRALRDAKTEGGRGGEDRGAKESRDRADAQKAYERERQTRKVALDRANQDAQLSYQRDLQSANLARTRANESANIARQRELQALNGHQNTMLSMSGQFFNQQIEQLKRAIDSVGSLRPSKSGNGSSQRPTPQQRNTRPTRSNTSDIFRRAGYSQVR